jgi:ankyrin repeat protein
VVKRLLSVGAAAEPQDVFGRTALHVASLYSHLQVVDVLLACGRCGDLDVRDEHGQTSLFLASWQGHMSVVERLLFAGADPRAKSPHGPTPLEIALQQRHAGASKLLDEVASCGSRGFRATRIWPRRRQVTLWRVAVNYSVIDIDQ